MYIIAKQALAWQELIKLGNGNWGRCLIGKDRTQNKQCLLQHGQPTVQIGLEEFQKHRKILRQIHIFKQISSC